MGPRKVISVGKPCVLPFEEASGHDIKQQFGMPADRTLATSTDRGLVDIPFHQYGASQSTGNRIVTEPMFLKMAMAWSRSSLSLADFRIGSK